MRQYALSAGWPQPQDQQIPCPSLWPGGVVFRDLQQLPAMVPFWKWAFASGAWFLTKRQSLMSAVGQRLLYQATRLSQQPAAGQQQSTANSIAAAVGEAVGTGVGRLLAAQEEAQIAEPAVPKKACAADTPRCRMSSNPARSIWRVQLVEPCQLLKAFWCWEFQMPTGPQVSIGARFTGSVSMQARRTQRQLCVWIDELIGHIEGLDGELEGVSLVQIALKANVFVVSTGMSSSHGLTPWTFSPFQKLHILDSHLGLDQRSNPMATCAACSQAVFLVGTVRAQPLKQSLSCVKM